MAKTIVPPSLHSQLIDLIATGAGYSTITRKFPFLKQEPKPLCTCKWKYFDQLDVLNHLWDKHVQGARDWTEGQFDDLLRSLDPTGKRD